MAAVSEPALLPAAPGFWEPAPGCDDHYAAFPKEARVVVSDGTPIVYARREPRRSVAPGAAMIFASSLSCSDVYWADVVPRLVDAGHVCIVPDTRGHGGSGLPRPPGRGARNLTSEDLSVKRMALDLGEVLDDAGIDDAIVVGHSMGAQVAFELYRLCPERVSGLVLVAGACDSPLDAVYGRRVVNATLPVSKAVMTLAPEIVQPIWPWLGSKRAGYLGARLFGAAGPKTTADGLHPYLLHLVESDPAVLVRALESMRRHSARDLLPRVQVPVLLLAAGKDAFTPRACSEELFERIPTAEITWFPEAGHTLPIEEPAAIVDAIEEWSQRRVASPV
ncbi:MAG: alpha/beta hydrolase [Acidimicrobiia bacterium]|nr:alpha/beta hydrolase [Acidimicrobiia bacterium]